ncbi:MULTISPECIES: AI-2E family transporter [unclassified Luteimonas]|uniref:AI-2E family transporter n=1 Tax=unclassified Luteimonas TaxID=2629088 RepID=UPI00160410F1|nr:MULTISPECIES: AI-2E family transporter [unclassified Luteimonas]MBB1472718.1 AI-2E family transporter [Luteimonas sp. MC1782]MBB6598577.1 AI-2E family transporter [Luteimonas sp. MC1825]QOC89453.1 AI-2E family transporter [Luteimonas sp. MC1825]
MPDGPDVVISRFLVRLQRAALLLAVGWLVWVLAPVLTPFVLAAMLAWLGDPLVDRLEARGRSRNVAVLLVFTAMLLLLALALLILVPMIVRQVSTLVESLPGYGDWLLQTALPWVEARTGLDILGWLDPERLTTYVRDHWERAGGMAATALGFVSRSGFAVLGWVTNLVLLPVITFFFLRDWDRMVERVAAMVPRDHLDTVTRLARDSSDVLGGFLRGQFLVMLILGVMYGVGLWGVGLEVGLLIGLIAGLLTFVPYLGPASGIVLGVIAALVQFGDWQHVAGVLVVFGIGQVIESYWLTPKLVGDRIGLHPVAVIFAVLAGGQLFGFLGMLLALPAAAVANVLLRFAHERYTASRLYAGQAPTIVVASGGPTIVLPDDHAEKDSGGT